MRAGSWRSWAVSAVVAAALVGGAGACGSSAQAAGKPILTTNGLAAVTEANAGQTAALILGNTLTVSVPAAGHQWSPHLTGQVLQQIGGPVLAPNGTALFSFRAVQVGRARLVMDDLAGASASSPRSWWIGVNVGTLTLKPSEFVPHPAPSH